MLHFRVTELITKQVTNFIVFIRNILTTFVFESTFDLFLYSISHVFHSKLRIWNIVKRVGSRVTFDTSLRASEGIKDSDYRPAL